MKVNCFIPFQDIEQVEKSIASMKNSNLVSKVFLLTLGKTSEKVAGCETIEVDSFSSTAMVKAIAAKSNADYTLIYTKTDELSVGYFALERMVQIAESSVAGMVYSDHYQMKDGVRSNRPVVTYQQGSLRDDFDFGSMLLYRTSDLKEAAEQMTTHYAFAGLYDLRLKVSESAELVHINEYLYTEIEDDNRKSGEKQFDYVDPKNRAVQIEMEQACTEHLKKIGGYLKPEFKKVNFNIQPFEYEASVIIPVFNRVRTLADAIQSVLNQKTNFKFNLIIVDNYSTDGTTELIKTFASDKRLIHVIPEPKDLGIGGCWNVGVAHEACGKFAVQLDSDDVYSDENTLQKIVDAFYEQDCVMVVGSYMLTDFDKKPIPPGMIDHKEWTPDNGRNNALRINGLGAPRAFFTPMLREIRVPNTSYGEDYALGLAFSREYQIGRIYDVLYLCRRWEDNSDASLDVVKMNGHNTYKDRIRTWELQARIALNKNKNG
ncbi:MAG: glycosyltransferase family 2 protein [Paludibacter sp.]|nr:glycosyltransferase family 2 protein [Paludibacter sp.]